MLCVVVGCGKDDDKGGGGSSTTSLLIGTWDAEETKYYADGEERKEKESGYWTFTESTVSIHSDDDVFDGQTVPYTFNGKRLVIDGVAIWDVVTLTSSKMVLKTQIVGATQETTFKKR